MRFSLYIHVPFCLSKCPYCDFYSLPLPGDDVLDAYTAAVGRRMDAFAAQYPGARADTLYFGGGTPSLLGGARLVALIERAARRFGLDGAEITLEANPADELAPVFSAFAGAGGNRVSLGMQSSDPATLKLLGRRHTLPQLFQAVEDAERAGIRNRSLDLMLGLPGQTDEHIESAAALCRTLGAVHVSAYLLSIEPGTPFAVRRTSLGLPDEDAQAAQYLTACAALEAQGFFQYEISNFSQPGRESRHNLAYWTLRPYYGIGPSAHSFLEGKRMAFSRDLAAFLAGQGPDRENPADQEEGPGYGNVPHGSSNGPCVLSVDLPCAPGEAPAGTAIAENSPAEYLMLRLRLTAGLDYADFASRFGTAFLPTWRQRAEALPAELIRCDDRGLRLTQQGFLLSNEILRRILWG